MDGFAKLPKDLPEKVYMWVLSFPRKRGTNTLFSERPSNLTQTRLVPHSKVTQKRPRNDSHGTRILATFESDSLSWKRGKSLYPLFLVALGQTFSLFRACGWTSFPKGRRARGLL